MEHELNATFMIYTRCYVALGRQAGWREPLPREGLGKAGVKLLRPAFSRAGQWHITYGAMYRLGLRSTELSIYNNFKNENEC